MTTKQKILNKALDLFNSNGVEKVTTRHIAKSIDMSQGNLHYHYPTKDMVLKALFAQFLSEVQGAERLTDKGFDKEEVIGSMKDNFKIMFTYRFFFKDNEVVWRRLPEIKKTTLDLFNLKKTQILQIIKLYKNQGIFREQISENQILFLAEQFIFSITSWLSAKEYLDQESDISEYYARFTFRIWIPYLKDDEMRKWEEIL
ncbi:TetR/AcrR family transcriptional regulator [Maribacter sp. 2307UL18-2]|uniref:TetR/AcrR family transcriptional regulator n=1 Tax=Maribacter sp. 2307UL18-2 TaxID=3386274 RepID=UPI0039BD6589